MNFPIAGIAKLICAIICLFIARSKGRSPLLGFILGFVFGLFALIGYLIAGDKKKTEQTTIADTSDDTTQEKNDCTDDEPEKKPDDIIAPESKQIDSCKPTISTTGDTPHKPELEAKAPSQFIETEDYILSSDKKTLIKGKDKAKIVVPDGVERIAKRAFENLKDLNEVVLPGSLNEIGNRAFANSSIERINIPGSITELGSEIFSDCSCLKHIRLEDGLERIGNRMFKFCSDLTDIELPQTLISISDFAFNCCPLSKIVIPKGVRFMGAYSFCGCINLTDVELPDTIEFIGIHAFDGCESLTKIVLPNSLVGISAYTFSENEQLCDVKLPDNLTCIMSNAFYSCFKLKLKIPQSIQYIESYALAGFDGYFGAEILVPKGKKEHILATSNCNEDCIKEYVPDQDFIMTPDIEKKTESFLNFHRSMVNDNDDRLKAEFYKELGISPEPENIFEFEPFVDTDNDIY